jgi:uncharacterized Zn finger protein
MGYYGWTPYVSVAERRRKALKAATKAQKSGASLSPIEPYRGAIAKTFWGKAWCDNLEAYSDYANRMPRGRTYVRNGSVIDLAITEGAVRALVMGSSLYRVSVNVQPVPAAHWQSISKDCSNSIDSLVELLQGKLSSAVMQRICTPRTGLFPAPKEISFSCSCPDSASMCKHIAAVLYGVGARLDQRPELLFGLRRVDAKDLVAQAGAGLPKVGTGPISSKLLDDSALSDVFGIELDDGVAPVLTPKLKPKPKLNSASAKKTQDKAAQVSGPLLARARRKTAVQAPASTAIAKINASITRLTERKDRLAAEIIALRDQRTALKAAPVAAPAASKAKEAAKTPKKTAKSVSQR